MSMQELSQVDPVYYKGDLTVCNDRWHFEDIMLGFDKFYYIMEGTCVIVVDGVRYDAAPGQLFFLPSHTTQTLFTEQGQIMKKYWFHCTLSCRDAPFGQLLKLPCFIDVEDREFVEGLFLSILAREKSTALTAKLEQKADILRLLAYYIRLSDHSRIDICQDSRVAYITAYIEDNLDRELPLEELSSILHFHPNYFVRFFKTATGMTPVAYILSRRIALAQKLLLRGTESIQDIGIQCGFQNPHYFSRYFKKATGMTPTAYQYMAINRHRAPY